MIALPNGCSRSKIIVIPDNWKSNRASIKKDWLIFYRFYDPTTKGTKLWGKDIPIKGMNRYNKLSDRQEITAALLEAEEQKLNGGWNPIIKQFIIPQQSKFMADIDPLTPFVEALRLAEPKVETVPEVHADMKSILNAVDKACATLYDQRNRKKYKDLAVEKIDSRHLLFVLEQCQKDNPKLSDKRYNKYLAYLSMIFNKLKSLQAIITNPVENVDRKKTVTKKRAILTDKEAGIIDKHLFTKDYHFWRYMHIFYHSGARNTEMRQVKRDSRVDLGRQEFTVLVKKGSQYEDQTRVISDNVLHLWQEVWNEAKDGEYLFGSMLKPGTAPQGERYVSMRWHLYVKKDLEIEKDWYALKHKHSDLVAKKLTAKHAQGMMGHKNERTTKIYLVGEDERQREEVKGLDITLTG